MTFQFPKPFFGGLFVGADAFDSESLAVRNTFGAMFIYIYVDILKSNMRDNIWFSCVCYYRET
jgi:hypothetical protein